MGGEEGYRGSWGRDWGKQIWGGGKRREAEAKLGGRREQRQRGEGRPEGGGGRGQWAEVARRQAV